jgi:hypothetical protein
MQNLAIIASRRVAVGRNRSSECLEPCEHHLNLSQLPDDPVLLARLWLSLSELPVVVVTRAGSH